MKLFGGLDPLNVTDPPFFALGEAAGSGVSRHPGAGYHFTAAVAFVAADFAEADGAFVAAGGAANTPRNAIEAQANMIVVFMDDVCIGLLTSC